MATVQLRDGEELNVICIGRGEPVMLLHAFASRAWHWLPNILPFTHKYRFYLPDLRGFGASHFASLEGRDVFETYANDVEDILNHFDLHDVFLGGISTGAYTCLAYNQQYGFGRIRKYLNIEHGANSLHCPGKTNGIFRERQSEYFADFNEILDITAAQRHLPYWDLPPENRARLRNTVTAALSRSCNNAMMRQFITTSTRIAEPFFTRYFLPVGNWTVYLKVMQAFMLGRDTRAALNKIKIPTTLMMGQHSRFFSLESQQELADHIPHAEVVVFENAGHALMLDQPFKFQQALARFLAA